MNPRLISHFSVYPGEERQIILSICGDSGHKRDSILRDRVRMTSHPEVEATSRHCSGGCFPTGVAKAELLEEWCRGFNRRPVVSVLKPACSHLRRNNRQLNSLTS